MNAAPVTVAVVSYETRELLLACLDALRPDADAGRARVYVVDNRSSDGSAAAARAHAPWAEVIEPGENLGFGRAVNLVAERRSSRWLLAANADVAPRAGALAALLAAGEADPRAGAVAPALILPGDDVQHSAGPLPTLPVAFVHALGLHRVSPALGDRLCLEGSWRADRARTVPWAIGACLLLRRRAFDAIGGFDRGRWMYAEDLDLGWRLREAGWHTRYEPGAAVAHASAAATGPAFGAGRRDRYMAATYEVIASHRGAARARATAAINLAGVAGRMAWMLPTATVSRRHRGLARDTATWAAAHRQGLHAGRSAP